METSSLDGEKTLKLKISNKYTQGFISNDINVKNNKNIEKFIQIGKYFFGGYVNIIKLNLFFWIKGVWNSDKLFILLLKLLLVLVEVNSW